MSRRGVLVGSAAAVAAVALAGCSSTEDTGTAASPTASEPPSSAAASPEASSPAAGGGAGGEALATTSEFPAGGGKVVETASGTVVVTQPADGDFKAFDGTCPHAGCAVGEVVENTILCPCHGSVFDAATGDRLEGPAPTGLEPVAIVVEGDQITLA